MANAVKGEVPMKLKDGREYTLVLDMEALVEAESAYGKPMQAMMQDATAGFVGASRAMLYGALRAKHPAITLRECSAIFTTDADAVAEKLAEAVELAFPDAKESPDGEGEKSGNPRGRTSGRSGAKRG